MSVKPSLRDDGAQLRMSVPYVLNPAFRALFKSASWNSAGKVFLAASTTANRNKWKRFLESVGEASKALADAEQAEATEHELETLAAETESVVKRALSRIETSRKHIAQAEARRARAQKQANELAPLLATVQQALDEELARATVAERARRKVIAPVLRLYEEHDLAGTLADFQYAARQGYNGKPALGRAQSRVRALREAMRVIGFRLSAIDDLATVSLNRPDKVSAYVSSAQASLESELEYVGQNRDESEA